MIVRNKDQRSKDYDDMAVSSRRQYKCQGFIWITFFQAKYRPSHADATYDAKYGVRAIAGGGRSSARETIGRVAAGAIAKKILRLYSGVEIVGYVQRVQDIELLNVDHDTVTEEMVANTSASSISASTWVTDTSYFVSLHSSQVEANIARCPDESVAEKMIQRIDEIR